MRFYFNLPDPSNRNMALGSPLTASKVAPGQVFSEYFGFPCQIHSTNCSKKIIFIIIIIIIINQSSGDMYNRPNGQTSMAAVQGPNRHLGT
jgi:hypothetical protein